MGDWLMRTVVVIETIRRHVWPHGTLGKAMLRFVSTVSIIALLTFAALCVPLRADASCYPGGTLDWGDIQDVEIDRCQPTNIGYPCYHATLGAAAGHRGIDGYVIAYRMSGREGTYVLDPNKTSAAPWLDSLHALQDADFFNLNIPDPTPRPNSIMVVHVDAPWNQVTVRRCHTRIAIDADITYDETAPAYKRFTGLIERLDQVVQALPWRKKNDRASLSDVMRQFGP